MKKLILIMAAILMCGCVKQKQNPVVDNASQSSVTTSWYGTFVKDDVTLTIAKTDDFDEAMDFSFVYQDHHYSEVAFFKSETQSVCDLGEDGIVISFEKKDEGIAVTVSGRFTYLDVSIQGTYRRP